MFFVAEVFRNGQTGEAHAQARSGRLGHLPVNQCRARLLGVARHHDSGFLKFQPEIVPFAGALTDSRENRYATVLHGDVVDEFLNQHGLADAGSAEQPDFSAFQERLNQVNDFNARLKHFERRGLVAQQWRRTVDVVIGLAGERAELIDRLAQNIHHAAERWASHGNRNSRAGVVRLHPSHESLGRFHSDGAHAAFAQVLLHLCGDVNRLRHIEAVARDPHGVENGRQMALFELHVEHRPDDLHDVPSGNVFLWHSLSYAVDDAPLTISIISFVMAACRTLFMCSVSASMTSPAFFVADSMAVMRAAYSAAEDSSMARKTCVST